MRYIYTRELWLLYWCFCGTYNGGMGASLTSLPACEILFLLCGCLVQTQYEGIHFGFLYLFLSYLASLGVLFFSEEKTQGEWIRWTEELRGTQDNWREGRLMLVMYCMRGEFIFNFQILIQRFLNENAKKKGNIQWTKRSKIVKTEKEWFCEIHFFVCVQHDHYTRAYEKLTLGCWIDLWNHEFLDHQWEIYIMQERNPRHFACVIFHYLGMRNYRVASLFNSKRIFLPLFRKTNIWKIITY